MSMKKYVIASLVVIGGTTPFIVNKVMDLPYAPELRNFDAFFYATQAAAS